MSKPKFILGAIAVLACAGSVFALKATKTMYTPTTIYTHAAGDALTKCTVPLANFTTTDIGGVQTLATFNSLQQCQNVRLTASE